jgi:hypothetical protein
MSLPLPSHFTSSPNLTRISTLLLPLRDYIIIMLGRTAIIALFASAARRKLLYVFRASKGARVLQTTV